MNIQRNSFRELQRAGKYVLLSLRRYGVVFRIEGRSMVGSKGVDDNECLSSFSTSLSFHFTRFKIQTFKSFDTETELTRVKLSS